VPARTMTVSASDKINVTPNLATLSFSIVTEGKETKTISYENNVKMNSVISFLKKTGIKNEDIKTTQYEITPVYSSRYESSKGVFVPTIKLYKITQTISVKIHNFDLISDIVGKLPNLGINKINGIMFSVENKDKYLDEIQKTAFDKAHTKAEKIAEQNDIKLGRIINVSVNNYNPVPYYRSMGAVVTTQEASPSANPNIKPGSQKLNISVSIKYEIR